MPASADDLVLQHLPIARGLALRYRDRGEPVEDLVQVACLGLVKAAQGYDADRGSSFEAYAVPTITGELRRHFRDHGWDVRPPRRLQELRARMVVEEQELAQDLGRPPTSEQLAHRLGVTLDELDEVRAASAGYSTTSIDAPVDREGGPTVGECIAVPDDDTEAVLAEETVRPLLCSLDPRDQRILALRYFGGATQQEIADDIGVTQMQVSRLITQALHRLRSAAEGAERPSYSVPSSTFGPARAG